MNGTELIAAERERQISNEGWTPEYDDCHDCNELARAAACYAWPGLKYDRHATPPDWPWDSAYWKPTPNDRIKELVKAGALIAAEIDRLQRKGTQ